MHSVLKKMLHTSKQFFFPLLLQCHVAMAILFVLSPHSHMLSVMLWMAFAGILASDSSPLILKITEVLEGMVVVAFRDFPSQLLDPRLYILTVTCKVPKREIIRNFVGYFLVLGPCIQQCGGGLGGGIKSFCPVEKMTYFIGVESKHLCLPWGQLYPEV